MQTASNVFLKSWQDPQWGSENLSKRPLRGPQAEIIKRTEKHVYAKNGGVLCGRSSRQSGKNDMSAILHMRHLWRNQNSLQLLKWVRTAPTHVPQIIISQKRLEEMMKINRKGVIRHPMFAGQKIQKSEGYIYRVGNATVEFMSSGPQSNVVGATANACLDMDEAHKISKPKFDEDFMPMTASTNAPTILWGVAADGLDTLEWYRQHNIDSGNAHLNLDYPCEVWMDSSEAYRGHVETRIKALGWDHPIIKTQYRLIPVSQEGTYISSSQARQLFESEHERRLAPRPGATYEILIDLAAGNEEFNPDKQFVGEEETATDSTVIWIYEVSSELCQNNIFPIIRIVNLEWWTGVPLPQQQDKIIEIIQYWHATKVTVDGVGVGRQLAESLEQFFGPYVVKKYLATSTSVSEDCFDLLARLNYGAVKIFKDDSSPEWAEFQRQVGWTKYSSSKGKMSLMKPKADKHIDMVKGLTYVNQNKPENIMHQILTVESEY